MQFFKDLSVSAFTAGFVAVLVGFTSSIAIVFQAAQAFGATPEIMASWMWAIGLGMGLCTLLPSLVLKKREEWRIRPDGTPELSAEGEPLPAAARTSSPDSA